MAWVGYLDEHGIGLRSLHEAIDTTTPTGKLTVHIFGALAEFERTLIRDRTQAGLAAARARGQTGGRRPDLNAEKRALAVRLYNEHQTPISRICAMMGISLNHPLQLRSRRQRRHRGSTRQIAQPKLRHKAMPATQIHCRHGCRGT